MLRLRHSRAMQLFIRLTLLIEVVLLVAAGAFVATRSEVSIAIIVGLVLLALVVTLYLSRSADRDLETSTAALRLQARFLQDKLRELSTLQDIALGFTQLESPSASPRYAVEKLAELLQLTRCALFMLDEE